MFVTVGMFCKTYILIQLVNCELVGFFVSLNIS